jgi:glycosyltransferase involved in cell wall biosynthesis
LVPCNDVAALVAALSQLMATPAKLAEMGRAGRTSVEHSYSASLEAIRIVDVYRDLWSKAA